MDRIERNLDRTDANVEKSKTTIKAIKRPLWTAIKNMFVSEKKCEDTNLRKKDELIIMEEEKKSRKVKDV